MAAKKVAKGKSGVVDDICSAGFTNFTWYQRLSAEDRATCDHVKSRVVSENLAKLPVARKLISTLKLTVNEKLIAEWFREESQ